MRTARAPASPAGRFGPAAGFTLLELLVVIGVISVLMGIGLGYLGRTDPEQIARSILAGELRSAQMTARSEGVPTEVRVRRAPDGEPSTVQSRLLESAALFHLEPNRPVLDERLRPQLGGEDVTDGRFGHARRTVAGGREPLLQWTMLPVLADLRDGFVLRMDLWLDSIDAASICELTPSLDVRCDEHGIVRARLKVHGVGGDSTLAVAQAAMPLPQRRWTTLEIGCDGEELWLAVDGRETARAPAAGSPQQEPSMPFVVAAGNSGFTGMIDEVRWLVFRYAPAQSLPPELVPTRTFRLRYDVHGQPIEHPQVTWLQPEERS